MVENNIRQAVILAGGRGERLRPLTDNTPKPLVRVNDRPFLEYLIEMLRDNGIREVVLLLGYLPEKITGYFGDGSSYGVDIEYSIGDVSDETGTRIRNAGNLLDDVFLLLYGDNYWPLNLKSLYEFYIRHKTMAVTTVYANKDGRGEYGGENNIHVDDNGYVCSYDKSRREKGLNGVDIGFFILSKKVLEIMPESNFSFEEEILPVLIDKHELSGYVTEYRYYYISTPESLKVTEEFLRPQKVVFLDRDGVINRRPPEGDYVKRWEEFEFLPGVIEALRLLESNGWEIYIITNQRGIARGMMSESDLQVINQKLNDELARHQVKIRQIYYCPHEKGEGCDCRKPKPGMLFQAASEHNLDLTRAIFIGDNERDIQAGEAAGCKTILIHPEGNLLDIVNPLIEKYAVA